jgi:CBS domain-containing protein
MKVSEIMTRNVCIASPDQKLREVAAEMERHDIGVLPVADNDRLMGIITDRDIAVRAISRGLGPEDRVRDVMSADVKCCFEEDEIGDLAQNMANEQIRRLPVFNNEKHLVGIVSLADMATSTGISDELSHHAHLAKALCGISQERRREAPQTVEMSAAP